MLHKVIARTVMLKHVVDDNDGRDGTYLQSMTEQEISVLVRNLQSMVSNMQVGDNSMICVMVDCVPLFALNILKIAGFKLWKRQCILPKDYHIFRRRRGWYKHVP